MQDGEGWISRTGEAGGAPGHAGLMAGVRRQPPRRWMEWYDTRVDCDELRMQTAVTGPAAGAAWGPPRARRDPPAPTDAVRAATVAARDGEGDPAPPPPSLAPPALPPAPTLPLERALCAVLLGAGQSWGTSMGTMFARANLPPRAFSQELVGAVVSVAYPEAGRQRVWITGPLKAALCPHLKAIASLATKAGTLAFAFEGVQGRPSLGWVATCWAPSPGPEGGLQRAISGAWGEERLALALGWATAPPSVFLPPLRAHLDTLVAEGKAAEEYERGKQRAGGHQPPYPSPLRTEASWELRARAMVLTGHLMEDIKKGANAGVPVGLEARGVAKEISGLLAAAVGDPGAPKPSYANLEDIVNHAGWRRVTRQQCGFDQWQYEVTPPGHLPRICAKKLGEQYLKAVGTASVPDNSVVWTVLNECRGHTQALAPHLEEALAGARRGDGPLRLYDPNRRAPPLEGRFLDLFLAEVERLLAQGTVTRLTEEELRSPTKCLILAELSCTFKGELQHTEDELKAIAEGDLVALQRCAQLRAGRTLDAFIEKLSLGAQGSPAQLLELSMSSDLGTVTKTRPIAYFQALSRGSEALGLAPQGIRPSGCSYPGLLELCHGADPTSFILKEDLVDYFYSIGLSSEGSACTCVVYRDRDGMDKYLAFNVLSMGQASSPSVAEAVSSLICAITESIIGGGTLTAPQGVPQPTSAESCTLAPLPMPNPFSGAAVVGVVALVDDFLSVAPREELEQRRDALHGVLKEVGAVRSVKKAVFSQEGTLMGKCFNLRTGTVSVPPAKFLSYLYKANLAQLLLSHGRPDVRKAASRDLLSRVAGSLAWLGEVVPTATLHLGGLYAAAAHGASTDSLCNAALADLAWWLGKAAKGALTTTLKLRQGRGVAVVASDAGSGALAAVHEEEVAWRALTASERAQSSTRREINAAGLAVATWGDDWAGKCLIILMDSLPAVFNFNKARGSDGLREDLVNLYDLVEHHDILATALYVPREWNDLPDAASHAESLTEAVLAVAAAAGARAARGGR